MNIINWNQPVDASILGETEKREVFLRSLKGKSSKLWTGNIVHKAKDSLKQKAPCVQVRGSRGEAQILISVGIKKPHIGWAGNVIGDVPTEPCVLMSQNGTAEFQAEDFEELNLVVLEAMAVYNWIVEQSK